MSKGWYGDSLGHQASALGIPTRSGKIKGENKMAKKYAKGVAKSFHLLDKAEKAKTYPEYKRLVMSSRKELDNASTYLRKTVKRLK